MNERRPESPQAASIRERAEKAFREMLDASPENLDALSPETLRDSLHELRVHQIELEIQNEEMGRAQEELDASRARYFDLYDLAPVGYCTVSEKGLILEANLTAATLLRVDRDTLAGRRLSAFISKEGQELYYWCRKKLMDTRQPQECDLRMVRKGGTAFFAHLNFTAARDENGAPVCRVALIDVTARKRAEDAMRESEEKTRAITNSAQDAILMMDPAGRISYWNPAAERILGYPSNEAIGQNLHALIAPAHYHPAHHAAFPAFLKTGEGASIGKTLALEALRKDGTEIAVRLSLSSVQIGGHWHAIGIVRDITEQKQAEEALREATANAERATAAKSEFLATMTHELRNPLTGVLGFAEILAATPLDEEQQSYTEGIRDSGIYLLSLINDILDFSSIEKGALTIHAAPFDLSQLVKSSSEIVRKSAADKGVAFHCDVAAGVPGQITGDERRIRQILINLLANAVKFTSDGSVSLRVTRSGEFLEFSIEDTGLGISSEALSRLFQLFTQADSTINQKYGGTGIGLAVSQRLAESMGGTISVVSAPGKGSTFTFHLPLEAPAGGKASLPSHFIPGSDGTSPSSPGAETPVRPDGLPVLVVEDDRSITRVVGKMLQSLGYRAEFAASGAEAVDAFAPGKFLAILMDLRMPGMNGFEAVEIIRARESGSRIPIIALTANVMPGSREIYLAAGMDDLLAKPFKKDELAEKLSLVVGGKT